MDATFVSTARVTATAACVRCSYLPRCASLSRTHTVVLLSCLSLALSLSLSLSLSDTKTTQKLDVECCLKCSRLTKTMLTQKKML